jgi:hypothetical protein
MIIDDDFDNGTDHLVKVLDMGCQAFFITTSVALYFLKNHELIQDRSVQRNAIKYLVIVPTLTTKDSIYDEILDISALDSKLISTKYFKENG